MGDAECAPPDGAFRISFAGDQQGQPEGPGGGGAGRIGPVLGYLIVGCLGLLVVVSSLVIGDFLDGLFDGIDAGGGLLTTPVIGAFVAAFGFGGALVLSATPAGHVLAALAGLGSGVGVGAVAAFATRGLMNMHTDEPVRTGDIVGKFGTVVTRIPADGLGEVTVSHAGHLLKFNARADESLPSGTSVMVTATTSSTSVVVRRAEFL